jgi:hypothetical protein
VRLYKIVFYYKVIFNPSYKLIFNNGLYTMFYELKTLIKQYQSQSIQN